MATEHPLVRAPLRAPTADDPPPPEGWQHSRLLSCKAAIPAVHEKYGRARWLAAVDALHPLPFAVAPAVASRAFHKIKEIFLSCALPFPASSLHLCEAPGGFVQWMASAHPALSSWRWVAVSLPEGPAFRRALLPTFQGDILECDVALVPSLLPKAGFHLVTADGAADMDLSLIHI